MTPLHCAAGSGDEGIIRLLVNAKANVNKTDTIGETPLHEAARNGNEGIIRLLVNAKANVDKTSDIGRTPLIYAAYFDHLGAARALIEGGAKVSIKDKVRCLAPGACVAGALVHAMPALTPSARGGGAWMN